MCLKGLDARIPDANKACVSAEEAEEILSPKIPAPGIYNWKPVPPEAVYYAIRLFDGVIYIDPTAIAHFEVVLNFELDYEAIESGGFITSGGYAPTSADVPKLKAIGMQRWNQVKALYGKEEKDDTKKDTIRGIIDKVREIFITEY